jgi:hypothetical protein
MDEEKQALEDAYQRQVEEDYREMMERLYSEEGI